MTAIPCAQLLPIPQRVALLVLLTRYEINAEYLADTLDIGQGEAGQAVAALADAGLIEPLENGWTYSEAGWEATTAMIQAGPTPDDPDELKILLAMWRQVATKVDLLNLVVDMSETTAYREADEARAEQEFWQSLRQWQAHRATSK